VSQHELFATLCDMLQEEQGGRCGICGSDREALVVDHDHQSGFVRGLLCNACNLAEGRHYGTCSVVGDCPICIWREAPTVAWIGWTTAFVSHLGGVAGPHPESWAPTADEVKRRKTASRRAADIMGAVLKGTLAE